MSQSDSNEMSMSIIEVDEVLKDDVFFSYESDGLPDEITRILNKWKQDEKTNLGSTSTATLYGNNAKFIDTRTFTRPKKKMNHLDGSTFLNMSNDVLHEQEHPAKQTPINLRIGGLVTSLQDSFLSATTPPVLMDSSLITSNDFSNLDFLSSEFENTNYHQIDNMKYDKHTHFNGYNLENVITDRNFLEKLITSDADMQKDENISRTDCILNDDTYSSSGNNTLQNSEDFSMKSSSGTTNVVAAAPMIVLNETFVPICDMEQQAQPINLNETIVFNNQQLEQELQHGENDENLDILNGTFGVSNNNKDNLDDTFVKDLKVIDIGTPKNLTFDKYSENGVLGSGSVEEHSTPELDFKAKLLKRRTLDNLTPITNKTITYIDNDPVELEIHSTPIHTPKAGAAVDDGNRTFTPNSPINLRKKAYANSMNNTIVLDNNDLNEFDFNKIPQNLLLQAEEERRSLVNFVEFEKSIQLLETAGDKSEKEFDEILNSLGNIENKILNEKMRQSLDNIKKRHSLLHAGGGNHQSENNLTIDHLKLSDSIMNKSMSSSSERLLNRRSRMYDEQQQNNLELNNVPGNTTVELVNNEMSPKNLLPEKKERDRDRFKTIRINRRPQDDVANLPDADADQNLYTEQQQTNALQSQSPPHHHHHDTNAVVQSDENNDNEMKYACDTNTFKKPYIKSIVAPSKPSGLSRLRFGQRTNTMLSQPLKSNSEDNLLSNNRVADDNGSVMVPSDPKSMTTKNLEFPMGEKAKSFHNIAGCDSLDPNSNIIKQKASIAKPVSKLSYPRPSGLAKPMESKYSSNLPRTSSLIRPVSSATRINLTNLENKIDTNTKLNVNLRSNLSGLKKPASATTTTRPSSAYYSYNTNKKNEYDHDIPSGGCSSNSLSSSASSRGSSQQIECIRKQQYTMVNDTIDKCSERTNSSENITNETVVIASNPNKNKLSGIRPPSNLRPPAARSGLPRPTGIPRR